MSVTQLFQLASTVSPLYLHFCEIFVVYQVEGEVKIWENTKEYLVSNPTDLEKKKKKKSGAIIWIRALSR